MFSNPFPDAFGIDIGDLSVKLVQLRNHSFLHRKPYYKLVTCRSVDLPAGLIVNGELQKPEEVRKRIMRLLKGTKAQKSVKSPWVVASLPETQSFIKHIEIKKSADELIEEDIMLVARKHIPFDEDNYYLQWQFLPNETGTKDTTNLLIGAVPKAISDSYTYLMESMGLGVLALEIEALALARSMVTAQKKYENEARAILHISATRSSLIIHDHDIIQFSTSLPYSGEILTTALSQKLRIPYEEAEKIKIDHGTSYKKGNDKTWKVVVDFNKQLTDGIKDALDFYYSHFPDANKVTRIVMCGGGSSLKNLDKIISTSLKVVARPGRPWKNLGGKRENSMPVEKSLSYAGAIGLALRAADNPFFTNDII
ncbi:MAG: type IV pilus assembly protein PilM [Candidatus Magasanikbacteria bacterium]|jgi:type IV pilus assembly protein PilM|nr:type IV pilus assembly protein PilM [Candidatus Magasanikbacteria bacterium]MBT4546733.1 type IV pilus assembly protein PilM [Candidatus Magasanikbacteria bacterium]